MFNARDWYWTVAGIESTVYSSARNVYVDPNVDAAYLAWKQLAGNVASNVASEAEIWFYVSEFIPAWLWNGTTMAQPAVDQYTTIQLTAYAADSRWRTETGGVKSAATGVPIRTDDRSKKLITDARQCAVNDASFTTVWVAADGNNYPVDATQIIAMSDAVILHTEQCFQTYDQVATDIGTNTITTLAQIDAAFAAVPSEVGAKNDGASSGRRSSRKK